MAELPACQADLWPAKTTREYIERLHAWAQDARAKTGKAFEAPPGEGDGAALLAWWIAAWRRVREHPMIPRLPEPVGEFRGALTQAAMRGTADLIALLNALTGADGRRPISLNSGRGTQS